MKKTGRVPTVRQLADKLRRARTPEAALAISAEIWNRLPSEGQAALGAAAIAQSIVQLGLHMPRLSEHHLHATYAAANIAIEDIVVRSMNLADDAAD